MTNGWYIEVGHIDIQIPWEGEDGLVWNMTQNTKKYEWSGQGYANTVDPMSMIVAYKTKLEPNIYIGSAGAKFKCTNQWLEIVRTNQTNQLSNGILLCHSIVGIIRDSSYYIRLYQDRNPKHGGS